NLTNEYGTLLAERGATIKVNNGQLVNASGTIDGGNGDLFINARDIVNKKQVLEYSIIDDGSKKIPTSLMLGDSQPNDLLVPFHSYGEDSGQTFWVSKEDFYKGKFTLEFGNNKVFISKNSASSVITSQGDINFKSNGIVNDSSGIYSSSHIDFYISKLENHGVQSGASIDLADYEFKESMDYQGMHSYLMYFDLKEIRQDKKNGTSSDALISAGGNITGSVTGMIDNVTIKAHAGPVSSSTTQRPSLSLPQAQGAGVTPGLQGDAQYLAQQLQPVGPDNGVPLPDFQLPSGDKGLFTVNGNSDSPYLIEVNPLLANLGQAGSGMLDRIDAALQQQLQG
ncbi:hypothetical protein, partial [Aeromonas hydrophila]